MDFHFKSALVILSKPSIAWHYGAIKNQTMKIYDSPSPASGRGLG